MIPADELLALGSNFGDTVCELGNKTNADGVPYRKWYMQRGIEYVCLDWNGKNGAIIHDMRYPIEHLTENYPGDWTFDMVTNFGFTEHVSKQPTCWENLHKLMRVFGRSAHCLPFPFLRYPETNINRVDWEMHGYWQPTIKWVQELARLNHYNIELFQIYEDRVRPTMVFRLMKMNDRPFIFPDVPMHRTQRKFSTKDIE